MKKTGSIRSGVAWLTASSTGSQILNFAFGIVLARLLVPEDFGMMATLQIFTGLAGFIAGSGMGQALIRAKEATKVDHDVVFTLQLIIGVLLFFVFFFSAPAFARWYNNPIYEDLMRISSITFLTRPFVSLPQSILSRAMLFKQLSFVSLTALVTSSSISIFLAYSGHGVWSLVIGGLFGAFVRIILMTHLVDWRPGFSLEWKRGRDLARYGSLVAIGDFIVYLRSQAGNFILSHTLGSHSLGLFNKANSLATMPHAQITGPVYQVSFRALAKDQDNTGLSQYLFLRAITLLSFYSWPIFLVLGWLSHSLIHFIYGEKWIQAAPLLTVFSLVGPFVMLEIISGSVLAARNWLGREIPVQITQLIIVCLGVLAGLEYGLLGVAFGATLANIYGALHMAWLASKSIGMPMMKIFKVMTAPFLMNCVILFVWFCIDHFQSPSKHFGNFAYLALMATTAIFTYLLMFFMIPIKSLESEKARWKEYVKRLCSILNNRIFHF